MSNEWRTAEQQNAESASGIERAPAGVGDPVLDEIVRRLVEELHPERIYLFGSQARGDAGPDSDYDLMVIVRESDEPPHRRALRAYRALRGIRAPKDVLVWTAAEFNRRAPVVTSLPAAILREGKVLHAA